MGAPKTLPEPSTVDPLAHPTLGQRLHAGYLRAGYNRRQFVLALQRRGLKTRYGTVMAWESGGTPDLAALAVVSQLVGYTMDELFHGYADRAQYRPPARVNGALPKRPLEVGLSTAEVAALLDEVSASDKERDALGEYSEQPRAKFAVLTRTFVVTFVSEYTRALSRRRSHAAAIDDAVSAARHASTEARAIAIGATPVSAAELATIGDTVAAVARKSRVQRKR